MLIFVVSYSTCTLVCCGRLLTECLHNIICIFEDDFGTILSSSDILSELKDEVDPKWKLFGVYLGVDPTTIASIDKDNKGVSDCMLSLVSLWVKERSGTGDNPRTWETVVKAVKATGSDGLAKGLAKTHGIILL